MRKLHRALGGIEDSEEEEERLHEEAKMNGYNLVFNRIPLQSLHDKDDQVCGRYVLMRVALKKIFKIWI